MDCAVETVGDRRGVGTWRFSLVGAFLCAVSEGVGRDRYGSVSNLVGGTVRASLGGGAASRWGCGILYATIKFSGFG